MTDRATTWSITINNPGPADEEAIALARQKGWKVEGQLEKGLNGTPHYQLMVRTPQVRFSALKKQFPRAHIEVARNSAALASYVQKEDTRVGQLSTSQDKYPSLSKFWDLIYDEISEEKGQPADEWRELDELTDKQKLGLFDTVCFRLIYCGYHVETLAVNPQTRAAFTKFAGALMARSFADRQTDRQRVESAEVNVPVLNTTEDAVHEEVPQVRQPPPPPPLRPTPESLAALENLIQSHTVVC